VVRVYWLLVAPAIAAQLPPALSHRFQRYAYDVGEPVQAPFDPVSVVPSRAVPEIVGALVFAGGATVVAVFVVVAVADVVVVADCSEVEPSATDVASPAPTARASPKA
jgi:hypothetical protein